LGASSGGLDSSLASITARLLKEEDKKIHSFAIGLDANAPDVIAAKKSS
jgi:asparagine synthase (glutamine-hydrolysing)